MKVQKITQEQQFTPIELRITFETADEYSMLRNLMWYNAAIPVVVFKDDPEKQTALSRMMSSILASL